MSRVALNSAAAIRQFRSTTAMMEIVDYDLVKITQTVIVYLSDCNNMSKLDRYCLTVMSTMVHEGEFTSDGDILARAIKVYGTTLHACMVQMKLYNSNGHLMYRFQALVGSSILLEPIH